MENKKTGLIITVGTRDVHIGIDVLKNEFPDSVEEMINHKNNTLFARRAGEILNKNFNKIKKSLSFPIIKPTLDYIKNEVENIDFVLLIATDQDTHPYNYNDTLYYAEIIKRDIQEKYKFISRIEVLKVKSNEVIYLDKMYEYFHAVFDTNKYFKELNEVDNIYLHLVGGIDAINNAIRFNAIQKFGRKVQYELHVNERDETAIPIQSVRKFLEENDKNTACRMAENYFYEGILSLELISEDVKNLAGYAHQRLLFNFDKAKYNLSKVTNSDIRGREIRKVTPLVEQNEQELLKELFWNAQVKYIQKNYVDFLLRFFRLIEEVLLQEVLSVIKIEYTEHKWDKAFSKYLTNNEQLKNWLDEKEIKYKSENPSSRLLKEILYYFSITNPPQYSDSDYNIVSMSYELQQLRNKSIGAHGFESLDEKQIKSIYEDQGVMQWLKQKLNIDSNPFDEITDTIVELCKKR